MKKQNRVKGFTLVEMIVVIAIIAILASVFVPSLMGLIRRARIAAAIADARTIKTTIETSLMEQFQFGKNVEFNMSNAFDKRIEVKGEDDEVTLVPCGAFTNVSWSEYKKNPNKTYTGSQQVDKCICEGLDRKFDETWKAGDAKNPLLYNTDQNNCATYCSKHNTNFGLVVVYDVDFNVRMMQLYRKGILVTFIEGDYVANDKKDVHFVGTGGWNTIYTDADKEDYSGKLCKVRLLNRKGSGTDKWYR